MRVLFILHSHICGGTEKHTLTLMRSLNRTGHEVYFCGPLDSWIADQLVAGGITCVHAPLHGYMDIWSIARIIHCIIKFKIDLVHGHMTRGALYAAMGARLTGRKSVSTAHLMDSYKRFHLTHKVIAVSHAVKAMLVEKGYEDNRVEVVLNGIEFPQAEDFQRNTVRSKLGIAPGQIALCMVAFPELFKGHDLAFEALRLLEDARLKLILIGRTEGVDHARTLQDLALSMGLESQVTFLGHRDDVYRLLSGMDIFLMPSRREAFSLSAIEATACGLPIVASRVGGVLEVLKENVHGLMFENGNGRELADQIRKLIHSPDLMTHLGQAAKAWVNDNFDESVMRSNTLRVYQSLLDNPARA